MVASKRIPLARAMEKLLAARCAPGAGPVLRPVAVAGGLRGYNSGAPLRRYERDESDDDGRRGATRDVAVPGFFSGSRHLVPCHFSASRFDPVRPASVANVILFLKMQTCSATRSARRRAWAGC
jgi:HSP20 family protein